MRRISANCISRGLDELAFPVQPLLDGLDDCGAAPWAAVQLADQHFPVLEAAVPGVVSRFLRVRTYGVAALEE